MKNNTYLFTSEEVDEFFKERKEHLSEHFVSNARYTLENLILQWKRKGVEKVTPALIAETLQTKYLKKTDEFVPKNLKRTSLKNLLNRVIMFYIWKLGDTHPFVAKFRRYIKDIKVPQVETIQVTDETINTMLDKLPTNYSFLIWLGITTSARRSALCNMNIDDIELVKFQDLERFFDPEIFQSLLDEWLDKEAAIIKRWDKYGGEHAKKYVEVPIFPDDIDPLLNYLSERFIIIEELGKKFQDDAGEFLFWNDKYERMNPESASKFITIFCRKQGIHFTIHHTRHYAIQKWYKMGMRKDTIRKFSGHKSNIIDRYLDISKKTAFSELATIHIKKKSDGEIQIDKEDD